MEDEVKGLKFTTPELVLMATCIETIQKDFQESGSLLAGYAEKLYDRLKKEIEKREDKFEALKFICSMDPKLQGIIGPISTIQKAIDEIKKFNNDANNSDKN